MKIDQIRDAGGHTIIGDNDDPILKTFEIDGKLIIIKQKSVHGWYFADKVDPQRTNISLPTDIQECVLKQGANSEIVARTVLTASLLFDKKYLIDTVDVNGVLKIAFRIAQDLIELENSIKKYQDDYQSEISSSSSSHPFKLPHIDNLESRCETIIQKADHVLRSLRSMARTVWSNEEVVHSSDVGSVMLKKYGNNHCWGLFLEDSAPFIHRIRNIRDGLEHPYNEPVRIVNFELQSDGHVLAPTITSEHRTPKLAKIDLSEFFRILLTNLIEIAEAVIAGLASGQVKVGYPHYHVLDIPKSERRYPFVQYCIWSETPLGPEGFFHQK
jgi:hypothetical protein